jgi:hypothetical protein
MPAGSCWGCARSWSSFFSVVSLIVNSAGKASQHKETFDALVRQEAEWRDVLTNYDTYDPRERAEFSRRSSLVIGNLIPIPNAKFNRLKACQHSLFSIGMSPRLPPLSMATWRGSVSERTGLILP